MRRKRVNQFQPVNCRKGVIARVMRMKRRPQLPNRSCMSSIGFVLKVPVMPKVSPATRANGIREATKTSGFQTKRIWRIRSMRNQ